jgi:hypothetical protein
MPNDRILHVIDVREELNGEVFFVAQCLEYNIRGIGATLDEARERFVASLAALKKRAELEAMDDAFAGLRPAAPRFWKLFKAYKENGGTLEQPYW